MNKTVVAGLVLVAGHHGYTLMSFELAVDAGVLSVVNVHVQAVDDSVFVVGNLTLNVKEVAQVFLAGPLHGTP